MKGFSAWKTVVFFLWVMFLILVICRTPSRPIEKGGDVMVGDLNYFIKNSTIFFGMRMRSRGDTWVL